MFARPGPSTAASVPRAATGDSSPTTRSNAGKEIGRSGEVVGAGRVQAGPVTRPPSGTVTFLLTDVEASTRAWESDPALAAAALRRQEEILTAAVDARRGFQPVEQGEGDSVVATFARAS